jgi:hypothetical protein
MIRFHGLAISVFAAGLFLQPAQSDSGNLQIVGQWSLTSAPASDRVQLTLHWKSASHTMNSTMEWSLERLETIAGSIEIGRDACTISDCKGGGCFEL